MPRLVVVHRTKKYQPGSKILAGVAKGELYRLCGGRLCQRFAPWPSTQGLRCRNQCNARGSARAISSSRLIGRRFRLDTSAKVERSLRGIDVPEADQPHAEQGPAHGKNENIFGTFEEDAFRRDFTINALYTTPLSRSCLTQQRRG